MMHHPGAVTVGEAQSPYLVSRGRWDRDGMPRTHGGVHSRKGAGPEGLSPPMASRSSLDDDRMAEIEATFKRIHRPLRWPMENFRRRYISNKGFVGYRFSRIRRNAYAGFSFGFALREDLYPGIREPPEVVAYAFVEPRESTLHEALVTRKASAVRRLAATSRGMGFPFELDPDAAVAAVRHRSVRRGAQGIFVFVASGLLMLFFQTVPAAGFFERGARGPTRAGEPLRPPVAGETPRA